MSAFVRDYRASGSAVGGRGSKKWDEQGTFSMEEIIVFGSFFADMRQRTGKTQGRSHGSTARDRGQKAH